MSSKRNPFLTPVIILICTISGVFIGTYVSNKLPHTSIGSVGAPSNKLNTLLRIIHDKYVDSVDVSEVIENAMPLIMSELDPHSSYIPAKDLEAVNSELEGSFSGIGIQFNTLTDTITIISVISGGPAEKVGLLAGDRIIEINDTVYVGKAIDKEVMRRLKGKKGTDVKVKILRSGSKKLLPFTIVRGDIPVNSVDASFKINDKYGYIKLSKFGKTTYDEFLTAIAKLSKQHNEGFIFDLRGNTGGYLEIAIAMINELLPEKKMIVYTEGLNSPRMEQLSNGSGSCQQIPIVVLIDEWSASASEIFAGAIQDNDRGTIIGRRSFGKGLVQQPYEFKDHSAIRLTIARYYTPSGRCIQKPYEKGKGSDYEQDMITRYEHGEFFSSDSIKQNTKLAYKTTIGRVVYGGGGIMPDIFIPRDTIGYTSYYSAVINHGYIHQFAFQYVDKNRSLLEKLGNGEGVATYLSKVDILDQFVHFAEEKGVQRRNIMIQTSSKMLQRDLSAFIIRNVFGDDEFYKAYYREDPTVLKAIEVLATGASFPTLPLPKTEHATSKK